MRAYLTLFIGTVVLGACSAESDDGRPSGEYALQVVTTDLGCPSDFRAWISQRYSSGGGSVSYSSIDLEPYADNSIEVLVDSVSLLLLTDTGEGETYSGSTTVESHEADCSLEVRINGALTPGDNGNIVMTFGATYELVDVGGCAFEGSCRDATVYSGSPR